MEFSADLSMRALKRTEARDLEHGIHATSRKMSLGGTVNLCASTN